MKEGTRVGRRRLVVRGRESKDEEWVVREDGRMRG